MREGWKEVLLGEIISIKHGYGFKGEYFVDAPNKNLLLTPGNFAIGGGFKSDKMKYYEGPISSNFILSADDVIVTMTDLSKQADTLGFSAKVPNDPKNVYLHNQRIGLVSLKNDDCNLDFIYWLLRTNSYQRYIAGSSSGATVKHTSPTKIYSAKVKFPESKETQHKIASILSSYDDLIENNLRRIQLLEEKAQLTYEEWFIKMRFPGYETAKFDTVTGLPEGWEILKLNDVADINSSSIKKNFEGKIKYIDIASVSPNKIDYVTEYEISLAPGRAKRIVKHGDVIWSCVRPNRKSYALIWKPEDNLIASTGFCVISPKTLSTSYLYQYLTTESFVGYLTSLAGGAAYPAVKAIDFSDADIIIPNNDLLLKFNQNLEANFDAIWNLENHNRLLKEARDILLPRLMSGMIDVEKLELETLQTIE